MQENICKSYIWRRACVQVQTVASPPLSEERRKRRKRKRQSNLSSAVSVVTSPFSFLILLIWVLSLFFLMSLANGLPILFIFSKNQILVLLIFATAFFVSISFISALIFMISFLLLTLGFVCPSFSSSFRCNVRLFIWDFSCCLR